MATGTQIDVVMPQMGVSVSEGTITKTRSSRRISCRSPSLIAWRYVFSAISGSSDDGFVRVTWERAADRASHVP